MPAKSFFTHPFGILISALIATFLWGSALPFVKKSYAELGIGKEDVFEQLLFAGYRFIGAAILIMLFMKLFGRSVRYQRGSMLGIVRVSIAQTFFQYFCLYLGLSLSTGIQGSIISGTTTFFQIIVAYFLFKGDTINGRKATGLIIGFLGVILVNTTKGDLTLQFGLGEWLILSAMFFGGLGNVLAKKESRKMEIMYMTSYQMLLGGLGLFIIGVTQVGFMPFSFTFTSIMMFIYLTLVSAVSFVLWNSVMKYNQVGKISIYLFLIPVFGVFLSTFILGEVLSMIVIAAMSLVAVGIVIVNSEGSKRKSRELGVE